MKTSPFKLIDIPDGKWGVAWPDIKFVTKSVDRKKLFDLVFDDLRCDRLGVGVTLNSGELDILWIDSVCYWQTPDSLWPYGSMYVIGGVVFDSKKKAVEFHTILERQLTWYYLKNGGEE